MTPEQAIQQALIDHARLVDAVENLVIGIGMGWDLDGLIRTVCERMPTASVLRSIASVTSPAVPLHMFIPHKQFPWFCDLCGYTSDQQGKHVA